MHIDKNDYLNFAWLEISRSISWILWANMDKTRVPLGHKRELGGGERGSSCVSLMVGWFELIAITIL